MKIGTILAAFFSLHLLIAALVFGGFAFLVLLEGPLEYREWIATGQDFIHFPPYLLACSGLSLAVFWVSTARVAWYFPREPVSRRLRIAALITVAFGVLFALDAGVNPSRYSFRTNAAIGDFRPQDIPRTEGMRLGTEGVPRLTIAKVLNHADLELVSAYDRSGRDPEKQKALDAWGRRFMMIVSDPEECDARV